MPQAVPPVPSSGQDTQISNTRQPDNVARIGTLLTALVSLFSVYFAWQANAIDNDANNSRPELVWRSGGIIVSQHGCERNDGLDSRKYALYYVGISPTGIANDGGRPTVLRYMDVDSNISGWRIYGFQSDHQNFSDFQLLYTNGKAMPLPIEFPEGSYKHLYFLVVSWQRYHSAQELKRAMDSRPTRGVLEWSFWFSDDKNIEYHQEWHRAGDASDADFQVFPLSDRRCSILQDITLR